MPTQTLDEVNQLITEEKVRFEAARQQIASNELNGQPGVVVRIIAWSHANPKRGVFLWIFGGQFVVFGLRFAKLIGGPVFCALEVLYYCVLYLVYRGLSLHTHTAYLQKSHRERLNKLDHRKDVLVQEHLGFAI